MARVLCLYFSKPLTDVQAVAEVFYRATPTITWRSPFALFLEISKCQALYKEPTFLARTRATLRRIGLEANLAVADDIGTALGLALFRVTDKAKLPIEAISFYVDPLGHDTNNSIAEMARTLRLMGAKTIGDFLNVPARELASRFSRLGLLAHLRAQGQMPVMWPSFSPREQVIERFAFDEEAPAENLQAFYFPLRPMIERTILRLRGRGLRLRQMDIVLRQEHSTAPHTTAQHSAELRHPAGPHMAERRLALHIQLPHVSGNAIFQILREKLETHVRQTPLTARITDMRLEVVETAPYSPTQKNIFDQKKEETEEALFQLVNRLATRLGPDSVFFADPHANYLPEKNWQKVQSRRAEPAGASSDSTETGWSRVPERPLRLLPKPIPLEWTSEQWAVIHKEILLTDWWEPHAGPLPLERVYFRLASKNPTLPDLWVCRSSNSYFLHGVFE